MERISSGQTFFMKRIVPVCGLGGVVLFLAMGVFDASLHREPGSLQFLLAPVLMLVFGFIVFRKLVWPLADEVEDGGSYLLIRRGDMEERVPLSNIMNVSFARFNNPRRVTLRLRTPCAFGDEIAFIPKMPLFQFNAFARNAVVESLMRRADDARGQSGST